jgi:hypothetical protein
MRAALLSLLLLAAPAGTSAPAAPDTMPPMRPMPAMPPAEKVPVPGGETYRLRFGDDVSLNDTCPVAKRPLNPRMRATWVNGKPIGFC